MRRKKRRGSFFLIQKDDFKHRYCIYLVIPLYHYIKWYKFGFTRLFDNLSLEIRNGRLSREEALGILQKYGEQKPDEDIKKACDFMGISEDRFYEVIEKFRNHHIWYKDKGTWKINNFIIQDWSWV